MKTATGLAIVAVGAILAFAVTGHPGWLNVQAAGWVLILVGLAGMFIPRSGFGWLRRQVVRRPPRRAAAASHVTASHVIDSNVVASNGTALPPGAVVLTPEQAEAVKAGALLETEPEVFPGRQLSKAVTSYNQTVGSLEGRVLVSARRLNDLGVTDAALDAPKPVEETTRTLSAPELVASGGGEVERGEFGVAEIETPGSAAEMGRPVGLVRAAR